MGLFKGSLRLVSVRVNEQMAASAVDTVFGFHHLYVLKLLL